MSSTLLTTSAVVVVNHQHHRGRQHLSFLPPKSYTNNKNKIWVATPPPPPQPLHLSITNSSSSSWRRPVAALDSSDPILHKEEATRKKYYFVVANAKFMLDEEEHFQEQLAERIRLFQERSLDQDFWLLIEPKFLDKFPNITKRLKRPAVALVSTNGSWITFMKLRLDRVLSDSFEADTLEEALASNPVKLEFEKPENWVAPYPKYEAGWWDPFLPTVYEKQQV